MISKTKRGIATAGVMLGMSNIVNDAWPVKLLFHDKQKSDLLQFINELNYENSEYMSYSGDINEFKDLTPTYQQLNQLQINQQSMTNIVILKSLENILNDRLTAFQKYFDCITKSNQSSYDDICNDIHGTVRYALDTLFVYIEQELQQIKQYFTLNDLKKLVAEAKADAQRRANNYMQEISAAENEVANAEKNLQKTKESYNKLLQQLKKMDQNIFEGASAKMNAFFSSTTSSSSSAALSPTQSQANQGSLPSSPPPPWIAEENKSEKYKELEENIMRQEKELRENIRELLSCLAQRDQIYAASRKAYQKLNKECKLLIYTALKKIVEREKESLAARQRVIDKLEEKVNCIDIDQDESEFIENNIGEYSNQGELILHSQALSILGDIHILDKQHQEMRNTGIETNGTDETTGRLSATSPENGMNQNQMEQTCQYFSTIFYLSEWNVQNTSPNSTPSEILAALKIKSTIQRGSITPSTDLTNPPDQPPPPQQQQLSQSPPSFVTFGGSREDSSGGDVNQVELAIYRLCQLCDTMEGRKLFVNVLNQFRSKKVEVGLGFSILGAVVWYLLTKCLNVNDVHNAKIIMILSQTFYRLIDLEQNEDSKSDDKDKDKKADKEEQEEEEVEENADNLKQDHQVNEKVKEEDLQSEDTNSMKNFRVNEIGKRRQYLKEIIISHTLWQEGRFWEQALWQCVLEQLQMMQYEVPWYELSPTTERVEAVQRVHDVIFSQVMAIAHSMIELGCSKASAREFVYRMCVIHQLSERQRQQLLSHLIRHEHSTT